MNYKQSSPEVLRQLIRDGELVGHTSGMVKVIYKLMWLYCHRNMLMIS